MLSRGETGFLMMALMAVLTVLLMGSSVAANGPGGRMRRGLMVFRASLFTKICCAAFGLWVLAFIPDLISEGNRLGNSWGICGFVIFLIGSFGTLFLATAARRNVLQLDLERRTYRLRWGWLFWMREIAGGWQDFSGVFIQNVDLKNSRWFYVRLKWQGKQSCLPCLVQFTDLNHAAEYAAQMAQTLNIPVVASPYLS